MRKVRMNVQGRVQGVGFRYMTKMVADQLGITGAVWNAEDGSVYIEAIGDEATMNKFIEKIKASPSPAGRVTNLVINDDPMIEPRDSFSVDYRYM